MPSGKKPSAITFLSTLSLRRATPAGGFVHLVSAISIHALLAESDFKDFAARHGLKTFLSTLSLRRATGHRLYRRGSRWDFYPRSPCGERRVAISKVITAIKFLSTLSLRRATSAARLREFCRVYFYPRSPCGERLHSFPQVRLRRMISIHALLAESDAIKTRKPPFVIISIHALLAESDGRCDSHSARAIMISIHALLAESDNPVARFV